MTIECPDKEVEPDPYTDVYFRGGNSYSQVRYITMVTNGSWRGFQPDTIQQEFFEDGNKVQVDKYRNNEVNSTVLFDFNESGTLIFWENKSKESSAMKTHYFYDDWGRISKIEQYSIYKEKGDSALRSRTEAMYTNQELTSINTPYMHEM